jgi:hypothetical protein
MNRCVCGQTLVKDTAWEIAQLVRRKSLCLSEIREVFREAQRLLESSEPSFVVYRREKP